MKLLTALLLFGCGATALADCKRSIHYGGLGVAPGEKHALPFGAQLFSSPETAERVVAIHPGGTELNFTLLASPGPQIMRSSYRDGSWQRPVRAGFSDEGFNTEPSISPDGRTLYFVSTRPPSKGTDIWKVERSDAGWGEPTRLGDAINGDGYEWHPQVAANGDLYFAAADRSSGQGDADLYLSKFEKGAYQPAVNLGAQINSPATEWDPYVNPSGSYLIFKSNRPGGYGGIDIYKSERVNGAWSAPLNLGPIINTADDEDSGDVTPDGRYFIFSRSKPGAQIWKMYWIGTAALRIPSVTRKCRG